MGPPMMYRIGMAVRPSDQEWKRTLNRLIMENQAEINKLLISYNIPILDEVNALITAETPSKTAMIKAATRIALVVMVHWRAVRAADVPEPEGYRLEDYRAPTPATLRGGRIIGTEEAEKIWRSHSASFVDVLPRPPRPETAGRNAVARQAARRYPRQHLAARHRLWRARAQHGRLFRQGTPEGDPRRPRQVAGSVLSGGLLDVVERGQARALARLFQCRLVSRRHRRLVCRRPAAGRTPRRSRAREL